MVLPLKNSRNVQNLVFLFLKNWVFFVKEPWIVSKTLIVINVSRLRFRWYHFLIVLKTFKIYFFSEKKRWVLAKEPWNVSKKPIVTKVSRMRLKWYYCLRIIKTFKSWVFFWKRWVYAKKDLEMFQDRWLWQNFPESVSNGIFA